MLQLIWQVFQLSQCFVDECGDQGAVYCGDNWNPGISVEVRTGTCTTVYSMNMDTKAWYAEAAVGITPSEMPNHPGFQALGWWIVRVLLKI